MLAKIQLDLYTNSSGRGGGIECGGKTWLFLECDQKRDQAKSKALEIYFQNFVISWTQETSI